MKPIKKNKDISAKPSGLRSRAEVQLKKRRAERKIPGTEEETRNLLHELQVHQIELEMQNEELRQARGETEAALEIYTELYDFAPVGYLTFDSAGIIRSVNLTGAKLLGTERSRLIRKLFGSYIANEDRQVFLYFLKNVFERKARESCEVALKNQPLFVRIEAIASIGGQECRAVLIDMTERRKAEGEVRRLNEELERKVSELEGLNKELETYSYTISHDLQAPLRRIEGFTRIIVEEHAEKLDEAVRDYFNRVLSASQKMSQLTDALLTLSRLNQRQLNEINVNLSSIANIIAGGLKKREPGRQVDFIIHENVMAGGDKTLLHLVIENLFENAWKFTGRHLRAKIEFGVVRMEGRDVYFVRDDGAGFDMKYSDRLFTPFHRFHTESEFPGIGIGLATTHRIITRHGGRIWAESAPEKGATFFFTLA